MSTLHVGFPSRAGFVLSLSLLLVGTVSVRAQSANPASIAGAAVTGPQIVAEMEHRNQLRAEGLRHYQATRHYEVFYKGYAAKIGAKMVVEVNYNPAKGKTFRIVSQSGSNMLLDKVLKRLLDSEKDAGQERHSTALTSANYKFRLAGIEQVADRPAYILEVEPLVDNKYLYRGKVWVDVQDFAVARIEAQPAKNPSFWISKTLFKHQYEKTDGFWLPAQNRSETKVRIGGTAVLTIDYGKYQIDPASVVAGVGH